MYPLILGRRGLTCGLRAPPQPEEEQEVNGCHRHHSGQACNEEREKGYQRRKIVNNDIVISSTHELFPALVISGRTEDKLTYRVLPNQMVNELPKQWLRQGHVVRTVLQDSRLYHILTYIHTVYIYIYIYISASAPRMWC